MKSILCIICMGISWILLIKNCFGLGCEPAMDEESEAQVLECYKFCDQGSKNEHAKESEKLDTIELYKMSECDAAPVRGYGEPPFGSTLIFSYKICRFAVLFFSCSFFIFVLVSFALVLFLKHFIFFFVCLFFFLKKKIFCFI